MKTRRLLTFAQGAIRACMHSIMGLELGAPLPEPVGGGGYWQEKVTCIGTGEEDVLREQVLRPDWERSWDENKHAWLQIVVLRIQTCGWDYQKALTREDINKLTQADIREGVKTAFDWMVRKYERERKDDGGQAKKEAARRSKINGRKTKVCTPCGVNRAAQFWSVVGSVVGWVVQVIEPH